MSKPLISITKNASKKLLDIIKTNNAKAILFDLKSGGCNGFEYRFKPIDTISNDKNVYIEGDLKIEICDKSLMYILGTNIDWNKDIMGQSFKFDNPLSQSSCGCGSSFSPKLD